MMALILRGTAGAALLVMAASVLHAQDFRVDANISSAGGKSSTKATTWFHAAKAFDSVYSGNQMTIYEPAQGRFVLIDDAKKVATEYTFDVMTGELELAHRHSERQIRELRRDTSSDKRKMADSLEFYLHPKFQERDQPTDATHGRLTLASEFLTYTVDYVVATREQPVEAYLAYADWAARFNFFVTPQRQLPGPRLHLNEVLRRRRLLPTMVRLEREGVRGKLALNAEHRYDWTLGNYDLDRIRYWDRLLQSPGLQWERFEPRPVDPGAQAKR